MAAVINITCPNCAKASKAPATLAGKKIKCKECQTVFVVQAAGAKTAAAAKAPVKKVAAKPVDEDAIDKNPYGVVSENLAARCPHCALPLDPPDSRICLHCGYDMQKRKRVESKKTVELKAGDYFLYHLRTIFCLILVGISVAIFALSFFYARDLMEDTWLWDDDKHEPIIKAGIIPVYVALFLGIVVVAPCVRVIIKRLVNFTPPETVIRDEE